MMIVGKKGGDGNFSFKRFAYYGGICIVWFLLFFIHTSQSTTTPLPESVKESKDPSIEVMVSSSGSITNNNNNNNKNQINNNNMPNNNNNNNNNNQLVHAKYEVFGKVQGVFFRKYTHKTAQRLGIKGTVRNTSNGTVVGIMEGPYNVIEEFKLWLSKEGSPKSRIDRIEFTEEREINSYTYDDFTIIKVRRR